MNKTLQDYVWSILPKEFKEEVEECYQYARKNNESDLQRGASDTVEHFFGTHNLTSDAEGEEMLTVPRKAIIQAYAKSCAKRATKYDAGYADCLYNLFGSKCLPDEEEKMTEERYQYLNSLSLEDYDNETSADEQRQFCEYQHKHHPDEVIYLQTYSDEKPQPDEPKFKEGDRAIYCIPEKQRIKARVVNVRQRSGSTLFNTLFNYDIRLDDGRTANWVDEQWLLPDNDDQVRAVTEKASEQFDTIVKGCFRNERRLNIAAQITASIYANDKAASRFDSIEALVRKALDIADALIAECEKGDNQ